MEYITEILCSSLIFGYIFYKWANKNIDYFSKRNIPHEKPIFLVGNNLTVFEGRQTTQELLIRLHNQYKHELIYGYYDFRTPHFLIRDPQLIRKVIVHDLEYFLNRNDNSAILSDETTSRMLCAAKDKDWMTKNQMFMHLFSEDKVIQIYEIVNACHRAALRYLKENIKTEEKEIDLEDFFHRYSNDVIASAVFGLKTNSYENKENEFFNMAIDLLRTRSVFAAVKAFYLAISADKVYRLNRIYIKALQYVRNFSNRIFGCRHNPNPNPNETLKRMEFSKILTGLLRKFSNAIKTTVLIIFPQIAIIVNLLFFIQSARSYVKSCFNPKPNKGQEERITPPSDEMKARDKKNKISHVGLLILKKITGAFKSLILTIFPQIILINRLYVVTKTAINYFRGKTVGQEVLQKKKKLSKVESALLKLERFVVVVKLLILTNFPVVQKLIKLRVLNRKALNYMKCLVTRQQSAAIVSQDMIHFMIEAKKHTVSIMDEENESSSVHNDTKLTEDEMAQCIMFLFSGLGKISKVLCVSMFELMKNHDIQEKLFEEVLKMEKDLNGADISYKALTNLKYLDMVICEVLRKWPSETVIHRVCTKSFILTDDSGNTIQEFTPGDNICFSVYGSHFDEEYFENPFSFNPERFSVEKQSNIKPYTYFPFGAGSRICKGKDLGLMVVKLMLYHLILEYRVECGLKSTPDLFAATRKVQLKQSEFFWMKLVARNKKRDEDENISTPSEEIIECVTENK